MAKNEVVACMIMESTMDPVKPRNLKVIDGGAGCSFCRFDSYLQEFDAFNRNRRNYAAQPMMASLNAPHILELIGKKSWFGEAGHPMTNDTARILTIDPKLISHRINSFDLQGKMLHGQVETMMDGYGAQMTRFILQGMEPAFSLRALAQLIKQADGTSLMQSKAHIVCYDWVILPSHNKAYRDQSKPIQTVIKTLADDGNTVMESALIPVVESQIKDFIAMESANVKLVSNVCEVAMESMQLTPNMQHVILRENGKTYAVKVEDRIKNDVRRYMMNIL